MAYEQLAISKALEKKLQSLTPNFATQWENSGYKPVDGVPYQQVSVLFASPENPTMGDDFHRERGFMSVRLLYPTNSGKAAILERAGFIKDGFKRGLSLIQDGVTTIIEATPEIGGGENQADRYVVPVRIRFFANIG